MSVETAVEWQILADDALRAVSFSGMIQSAVSVLLEKKSLGDLLLPTPLALIFSIAKRSSAERTIMHANSWDLRQMRLWCMDLVS